jgi:hypothetical protein
MSHACTTSTACIQCRVRIVDAVDECRTCFGRVGGARGDGVRPLGRWMAGRRCVVCSRTPRSRDEAQAAVTTAAMQVSKQKSGQASVVKRDEPTAMEAGVSG